MDLWVLRTFFHEPAPRSGALSGVILRNTDLASDERQQLAAGAGLPEVVFIDDPASGIAQVFTPSRQRPFAGYPVIAAAWLLHELGFRVDTMRLPAGTASVRRSDSDELTIRIPADWLSPQQFIRYDSLQELHQTDIAVDKIIRWAWIPGEERTASAVFTIPDHPPGSGVSAGVAASLAAHLGGPLTIRQGNNSLCRAVPMPDGNVDVCGSVAVEQVERLSWPPDANDK